MQKALMEMNVQLHHVVSDISGITGMKIIRAIVGYSPIKNGGITVRGVAQRTVRPDGILSCAAPG